MAFVGNVERIDDGWLIGWVWDGAGTGPSRVRFVIDGVPAGEIVADTYREDLAAAQVGSGRHAFRWRVPLGCYDGREHVFGGSVIDTGWVISGSVTATLGVPSHGLALGADGKLVGYLLNPAEPNRPLAVALAVDGVVRSRALAAEGVRTALFEEGPNVACGFSLELPAGSAEQVFRSRLEVLAPAVDLAFPVPPALFAPAFRLSVSGGDATSLIAQLHTKLPLSGGQAEFFLDGEFAGEGPIVPAAAGALASARLWLDAPLADGETVALSAQVEGVRVGETAVVTGGEVGLFSRDPHFAAWTGEALTHWSVDASVVQVPGAADEAGPALRIEALTSEAEVGQALNGVGADAEVTVIVSARASRPTTVDVSISGVDSDGAEWRTARSLTVWPSWVRRPVRLRTPADVDENAAVRFSLSTRDLAGGWLDLGYLACGTADARFGGEVEAAPVRGPIGWNAVRTPGFDHWTPPLRRTPPQGWSELAPGWRVRVEAAETDLTIGLYGMEPAEPEGGDQSFGARLRGGTGAGAVRLEAELDARALARDPAEALNFHLASPSGAVETVDRVLVLRRCDSADESGEVAGELVAALGPARVDASGRRLELAVSEAAQALVQTAARRVEGEDGGDLVLAFEFGAGRDLDVVLGDVRLGDAAEPFDADGVGGRVRVEDDNIAAQLATTRRAEHWARPTVIDPRPAKRAGDDAPPRWRWTTPPASVEVVVPVYEAPELAVACLTALRTRTTAPHTVTVIDDGSTGPTRAALERAIDGAPWMRLVSNRENLGYTRSANIGLRAATAEWVVLLNSDTQVTEGWLEGLLDCAASDPAIAMVGPVSNAATWQSVPDVFLQDGRFKANAAPQGVTPDEMAQLVRALSRRAFPRTPLLNGFCTLIKRSMLDEVGYLDEQTFPVGYGEENDLCVRVTTAGGVLAVADHVYVHHAKSGSFGAQRRDDLIAEGTAACERKHPDVDFAALQRRLADSAPLAELRERLRAALQMPADDAVAA